jgi:hypothetical protein
MKGIDLDWHPHEKYPIFESHRIVSFHGLPMSLWLVTFWRQKCGIFVFKRRRVIEWKSAHFLSEKVTIKNP